MVADRVKIKNGHKTVKAKSQHSFGPFKDIPKVCQMAKTQTKIADLKNRIITETKIENWKEYQKCAIGSKRIPETKFWKNKKSMDFSDLKVQLKAQSLGKHKESKPLSSKMLVVENTKVRIPSDGIPS